MPGVAAHARERADDRGHAGSVELYTPELSTSLGWKDWNLRLDLANIRDPGGTRERNHWRFQFASVFSF